MIIKLDEIYDYIARMLSAPITAKKKIKEIRDNIFILKMFPESGFDADEKFGKVIDSNNKRREITLKRDYIVLYFIDGNQRRVVVTNLFSTKSDYVKLFKQTKKRNLLLNFWYFRKGSLLYFSKVNYS